ncbi:hypothetical protein CFC21_008674 [Triticum aestivum]|uniref:DUF1639 domain-containing protein n=2 Tax=Triticum aestivum TaxID=4565 RepID=A0A3B5Z475_WHEAT|nr:uncharacterized protein C6orf132 homolog [Triticum aestivum]KAF6991604.1 hypothetical protein CFC21_008674 [Triticum aestivum]
MAATADPRAKPPAAPSTHHLEPWARPQQQQPPRPHRVESASGAASGARDRRRSSSHSHRGADAAGDDDGIEGLRVKLMGHLRDAADRLRVPHKSPPLPPPPPPPKPKEPEPERMAPPPPPTEEQQPPQADVADKPWKLRERTRRRPAALSSSWPAAPTPPSRRRKRAPFSVALEPEEIEEDIYALTGGRPRRRPRKRPRAVQRQLDSLFPGLWLAEVTADDYKVPDDE